MVIVQDSLNQITGRVGANEGEIGAMKGSIASNTAYTQSVDSRVQTLSDSFQRSSVKFSVQTRSDNGYWPEDSFITYEGKYADTHNAMDTGSGIFTAPFSGVYGFLFHGSFMCHAEDGHLFAYHNDQRIHVFSQYGPQAYDFRQPATVYFALSLNQNDQVRMHSGSSTLALIYHPPKFMGFLLQ
jgi:hypothetical protein